MKEYKTNMFIYSVVVAYHPDIESLVSLCEKLVVGGAHVVVVDNSYPSQVEKPLSRLQRCQVVALSENTGIACAQNIGLKHALEAGADMVAFFDQDSCVDAEGLAKLVGHLKPGVSGVVAPVCINIESGAEIPTHAFGRFGNIREVYSLGALAPVSTDIVISSGTVATAVTFRAVGEMAEEFFIDFVDIDWCIRCRRHGISIRVVPDVIMAHKIGEKDVTLGGYRTVIHSPARSYYKLRNAFLLFGKSHIPFVFSLRQLASALLHATMQLLIVEEKGPFMKSFFTAIVDGIMGVSGRKIS